MRECQQCGEPNQQNSRFCVVCGTPLAAPPGAVSPAAAAPAVVPPAAPARAALPTSPPPPGRLDAPPAVARSAALPPPVALAAPVLVSPAAPPPAPAVGVVSPGGTGRPGPPAAGGSRELGADFPLDGPRTLVGFLVSYENVDVGQYWPLHQGRNVLGRQGAATGLDIEVAHPTTSSLHAILLAAARPGRVVVEDASSTNGTFVNDNMLTPGQRWELRDGDRIRFGLFNAVIKIIDRT
jgi:hypothetical protein